MHVRYPSVTINTDKGVGGEEEQLEGAILMCTACVLTNSPVRSVRAKCPSLPLFPFMISPAEVKRNQKFKVMSCIILDINLQRPREVKVLS